MYLLFIFVFGLFIGSFLGVVIDRVPHKKSIIAGRSYCNYCKHNLGFFDLIPLASFIILRGKCRYCKKKLSWFYPGIELITALLFALTFYLVYSPVTILNYRFLFYVAYLLVMISGFIAIFFIDLKHRIIPDKILLLLAIISFVWLVIGQQYLLINNLLSALGSFGFFLLVTLLYYIFTRKTGMGGGDIKMSFVLGLFLGFPLIVVALYLAFLIGAIIAVFLIILKKKKFGSSIPFGPLLIIGTLFTFFEAGFLLQLLHKFLGI